MNIKQVELDLKKIGVTVEKGYTQISLSSYKELLQLEDCMNTKYDMNYRGQADSSWELKPGLLRKCPNIKDSNVKEIIRKYREVSKKNDYKDDEILAYGQHHGLLTQLLDVTKDLKVALFFAYKDAVVQSPSGTVSVWAFNVGHNLKEYIKSEKEKNPSLPELIEPIDYDGSLSKRQKNQKGLFLKFPLNCSDFKSWYQLYEPIDVAKRNVARLIQFNLPITDRLNCLNELAEVGITPEFLFPDDEGRTMMINMSIEIEKYR